MAFIPHLVIVTPNIVDDNPADDTLTVRRDKHDGDWLGRLPRGFVCKAVEAYTVSGVTFYRLAKSVTPWPVEFRPLAESGVEVWGKAAYLPDYVPGEPEPQPAPGGKTWQGVILAACRAVVAYLEG